MGLGSRFEKIADATVNGYTTITYTSATAAVSATPTVATGTWVTTAEAYSLFATIFAEVAALEVDVADIRAKFNKGP